MERDLSPCSVVIAVFVTVTLRSKYQVYCPKQSKSFFVLFLFMFIVTAVTMLSLTVSIPRALRHHRHKFTFLLFFLSLSLLGLPGVSSIAPQCPAVLLLLHVTSRRIIASSNTAYPSTSSLSFLHLYIFTSPASVFSRRFLTPATITVAPQCKLLPQVSRGCWSDFFCCTWKLWMWNHKCYRICFLLSSRPAITCLISIKYTRLDLSFTYSSH